MKPSEIKQKLKDAYNAHTSMFLWGPPGVGKSEVQYQVTQELGIGFIDARLSQMDPTDLKGLPYVNEDGYSAYATPSFLPQVERDGPNGVLFLDELNTAPMIMQAAGYQLILDGKLGDYTLPPGWTTNGAGNRAEDRAIATRMSTALGTRFGHLDFDVDNLEWKQHSIKVGLDNRILSFIDFRPNLLHDMDVEKRTSPTPRTWSMLNKHMPFVTPENEYLTYAAFVGEGAAGEFSAYMKLSRELPHIDTILAEPTRIEVPTSPSTIYAATGLIASATTYDNFGQCMKYITRMAVEYQTAYITDINTRVEDIEDHPEYTKWALANVNVIL